MNRIEKKEYFLNIVREVGKRSPCLRRQIGVVLVRDDCILATGYNGPPRGEEHCKYCLRMSNNISHGSDYAGCPAVHAEENSIINAARYGVAILGATMYMSAIDYKDGNVVVEPCYNCKRIITNAGIKDVIIE